MSQDVNESSLGDLFRTVRTERDAMVKRIEATELELSKLRELQATREPFDPAQTLEACEKIIESSTATMRAVLALLEALLSFTVRAAEREQQQGNRGQPGAN